MKTANCAQAPGRDFILLGHNFYYYQVSNPGGASFCEGGILQGLGLVQAVTSIEYIVNYVGVIFIDLNYCVTEVQSRW